MAGWRRSPKPSNNSLRAVFCHFPHGIQNIFQSAVPLLLRRAYWTRNSARKSFLASLGIAPSFALRPDSSRFGPWSAMTSQAASLDLGSTVRHLPARSTLAIALLVACRTKSSGIFFLIHHLLCLFLDVRFPRRCLAAKEDAREALEARRTVTYKQLRPLLRRPS